MNSENEHIESEFNARSHYIEVRKAAAESFFSSGNYALSANSVEDIRSQFKNLAMLIEHYGTKAVIESALSDRNEISPAQIAESVNQIIQEMNTAENPYGCVNWGDIKVIQVSKEQVIWPETADEGYTVIVDEADPSEYQFQEEIMNRFYKKHGIYITVQTEL